MKDYSIPEFPILIANPSIVKSRLIWQAMCSAPDSSLKSRFRWNQSYSTHDGNSSLVHELRKAKWVPQKEGDSVSFVRPCDALKDDLPGGFPYDTEQKWLEAIEFGKTVKQQTLENILKRAKQNSRNQQAKELGFESGDEAEESGRVFFNLLRKQGKSPDALLEKSRSQDRRMERLIIDLSDTEEKGYEIRGKKH